MLNHPLAIVAFIVTSTCSTIYRDAPQSDLTYRVEYGPFAGLYTTPERGSLIRDLPACLSKVTHPEERIFFFYDFPAGYLMTDMPWASNSSWQFKVEQPQWMGFHRAIEHYWKDPKHHPDIIVKMTTCLNEFPHIRYRAFPFADSDPFADLLRQGFTPILVHPHLVIYRRDRSSTATFVLKQPF